MNNWQENWQEQENINGNSGDQRNTSDTNNSHDNDSVRAESAFEQLKGRLDDISREAWVTLTLNPQRAAQVVLTVAEYVKQPDVHKRFENLAQAGEFNLTLLEQMADVAWTAWYTRHKLELALTTHDDIQVPLTLFQDASNVRGRMLKVLDYHLDDNPEVAAKLAAIRGGKGYLDMANDLVALAELYRQYATEIQNDQRLYQKEDEAIAEKIAREIMQQLSSQKTKETEQWTEYQTRAMTLLQQTYEEIRRAGHFLFYYELPENHFPSLFTAARAPRSRSAKPANDSVNITGNAPVSVSAQSISPAE